MSTLQDRLITLASKYSDGTLAGLSKYCGLNRATLGNLVDRMNDAGRTEGGSARTLRKVAARCHVPIDWVAWGEGPGIATDALEAALRAIQPPEEIAEAARARRARGGVYTIDQWAEWIRRVQAAWSQEPETPLPGTITEVRQRRSRGKTA